MPSVIKVNQYTFQESNCHFVPSIIKAMNTLFGEDVSVCAFSD